MRQSDFVFPTDAGIPPQLGRLGSVPEQAPVDPPGHSIAWPKNFPIRNPAFVRVVVTHPLSPILQRYGRVTGADLHRVGPACTRARGDAQMHNAHDGPRWVLAGPRFPAA